MDYVEMKLSEDYAVIIFCSANLNYFQLLLFIQDNSINLNTRKL